MCDQKPRWGVSWIENSYEVWKGNHEVFDLWVSKWYNFNLIHIQSHFLCSSFLYPLHVNKITTFWPQLVNYYTFFTIFFTRNHLFITSTLPYLLTLPLFVGVSRVRALSPAWTGSHARETFISRTHLFLPHDIPPNKKIKYNKILTYILRSIFLEIPHLELPRWWKTPRDTNVNYIRLLICLTPLQVNWVMEIN